MKFGDVLQWKEPDESRFMYIGLYPDDPDDDYPYRTIVCLKADPDTLWGDEIGIPTPCTVSEMELAQ